MAAAESVPAHEADQLRTILRHARIPTQRAAEFWERVDALTREFAQLPRAGDTVYGFAAGLYPTDYPTLPDANDESIDRSAKGNAYRGSRFRATASRPCRAMSCRALSTRVTGTGEPL